MRILISSSESVFSASWILFVFLLLGLICSSAIGHEWTVDGKKVKAKPVDFNGTKVLLEDQNGKQKAVPINELVAEDLQYLTNLLSIRNAEIQQYLEKQQIQQQQAQLMSRFVDVWTVRMVARNGTVGWRNYFAANSLQAQQQARREFSNVQITTVQRLRNSGAMGGFNLNSNLNGTINSRSNLRN